MRFLRNPMAPHGGSDRARNQDALIVRTNQRLTQAANEANARAQRAAAAMTRKGTTDREYFNFVTGLNEYLTL